VVKDGRFGPYVTDGETNATVPRTVSMEQLTKEQAYSLLAEKRAQGPAKKKKTSGGRSRAAAKA
jgi:DNA topoisomerase I